MQLEYEQLKRILVEDWDYQEKQVEAVADKLLALSPEIFRSFQLWLEKGVLPDYPSYHNFTPENLHGTYGFKAPATFLLLEWIRQEPEEALAALNEEFSRHRVK